MKKSIQIIDVQSNHFSQRYYIYITTTNTKKVKYRMDLRNFPFACVLSELLLQWVTAIVTSDATNYVCLLLVVIN